MEKIFQTLANSVDPDQQRHSKESIEGLSC